MDKFIKADRLRKERERVEERRKSEADLRTARNAGYSAGNRVTEEMMEMLRNPIMERLVSEAARAFANEMAIKFRNSDLPGSIVHEVALKVWDNMQISPNDGEFVNWYVNRKMESMSTEFSIDVPAMSFRRNLSDYERRM